MNFIAALVIYIGVLYAWGDSYLPTRNVKYGIEVNELGQEIGFQNGDKIVSVDQKEIESFYDIMPTIVLDKATSVQVLRNDSLIDIAITDDHIAKLVKSKGVFGVRIPFNMTVGDFAKESPAHDAGIKKGDRITGANGETFTYYDQFSEKIKASKGQTITLHVQRNEQTLDMPVKVTEAGMIGVSWDRNHTEVFEFETIKYGFLESIPAGIKRGWETSVNYLKQFKLIFNRKTKGYESLGGFITIGNIFPGTWNWHAFWDMTAFLSIILGIMNILPIPALDGGHVLFVLFEMVTGRKPSEKFLEYAQMVGLSLLLLLVLYANLNDIIRLFK